MPGRDKTGLDGSAWKHLNPLTAVAQRRETTTGVDARNRSTYSQVTATKPEEKTIPTDFGVLTALQQAGEKSRSQLSRVLSRRRKMVKEEKGTMMKPRVGKADCTADKLFDAELYDVLTVILKLKLDSTHSKYKDILYNNNIVEWEDFNNWG